MQSLKSKISYVIFLHDYVIACELSTMRTQTLIYDKKTILVPVLSHQTTRVKAYHLRAKREGDEFFTEGGLVNENSNDGGFLFIMNLKI